MCSVCISSEIIIYIIYCYNADHLEIKSTQICGFNTNANLLISAIELFLFHLQQTL